MCIRDSINGLTICPQVLQIVRGAGVGHEYVHDDVGIIQQHPVLGVKALGGVGLSLIHISQYEEAKCVESTVEIAVQVNGKVKARLKVAADIDAAAAIAAAKADPAVAAALEGKQVVKEIYVKGRLVNLAVKG